MSKILNAEAVLRSAIQLYADRDGLTEQEINGLANGDNRIREMLSFLSDGIVDEKHELLKSTDLDEETYTRLFGFDGTKPLMKRLEFFKSIETDDVAKLASKYPDEIWLQVAIVLENGMSLGLLPEKARDTDRIVVAAVYNNPEAFRFASDRIKSVKTIVEMVIGKKPDMFSEIGSDLKGDIPFIGELIKLNYEVFHHLDPALKKNDDLLLTYLENRPGNPKDVATMIDGSKRVGLVMVAKYPDLMGSLAKLKVDKEFIYEAMHADIRILKHVPEQVFEDHDFAIRILKAKPLALEHLPSTLRGDPDFIISAIKAGAGYVLARDIDRELLVNRDFALRLIDAHPWCYQYLDKDLKGERAIVLAAASKDGGIVQFLPSEFREHLNDKKIALAAVRSAGWSLQFFGESIRDDDEIVEEAIKEDGYAIRYASARIRDIERYALLAIENGNIVIDGLSDRLKGEIDIVRAAARKNPRSISFVDQKFFTDPEIQKLVFECDISLIKEPELLSPELKARYDSIMAKAREFNIPVDKFNTSQLEELIHNRTHLDGEDDRPLAVIIDPMSDDEGAFDYQGSERDIFDTHRVVYFRVNNTVELLQHYRAVTEHKKVDLLFVGGHGTSDRLHLGDVGDYDVRYLDKSDAKELMAIERGLEDDATVIFFSCSLFNVFVGESFGRMASRIIDGRRLFGLYRPDDWMTFQVEVDEMDGIKVEGLHDRSIVRCIDGECKIVD